MKTKRANIKSKHPYSSDKPIASKKQDILGRRKFAEQLALDLHSWDGGESLVVALYGPWGSGKTSLKNMVLEANERNYSSRLPVMQFNPWQLSGTGGISLVFFRELGIALRHEGPEKDIEKRAKKLDAYGATVSLAGSAAAWAGKAMPWIGIPGGPIVEGVGTILKESSKVTQEGARAMKANAEATKGLDEQKKRVFIG